MVELRPVRAWHPNRGADPSALICPVYDTLSEEELERYGHRPHNASQFVPRPRSLSVGEFTARAAARLSVALASGDYVQDPEPAFYVYGIRYVPPPDILETIPTGERRREYLLLGLVGALDLADRAGREVAMHERTFDDRVEERVALTRATGMSFAPIMAGYHLPDHAFNDRLESLLGIDRRGLAFHARVPSLVEAGLEGTTHYLWRVDDARAVAELRERVRRLRALVLDGHHRFTAARRSAERGTPVRPLAMLVDGRDRALRVLPWHRVLPASVASPERVLTAARKVFPSTAAVRPLDSSADAVERLHEWHRSGSRGFLIVHGGEVREAQTPPSADVGADFDRLHEFLEGELGLDPHDLLFVRSPSAALARIATPGDPGSGGTAFLLPPLHEPGIEARAFGTGAMMAHKSTMFLPKVAEGVVFAPATDGT